MAAAAIDIEFAAPDGRLPSDSVPLKPVDEDPYHGFENEIRDSEIGPRTCTGETIDLHIDWDLALAPLLPSRY